MRALVLSCFRLRDRFFGRGAYSITVPPMDGVLRPNETLETAPVLATLPAPHHLHTVDDALWCASGASLYRTTPASCTVVQTYAADISAFSLATHLAHARPCVATVDGSLDLPMGTSGFPENALRQCVTGLTLDAVGGCFVTVGSAHNGARAWQKDLLERRASGSLWYVSAQGQARLIADALAWPQSPLVKADGSVLLAETSASRVLRVHASGKIERVLNNLPGYPAGLAHVPSGYALCIQAPRNQLVEFILREPEFCTQMIREVEPELWIAPALSPAQSFREPLQGGAIKQLGIMKPWAPTRSYGLVVELDAHCVPVRSHHSRANGTRHGTVSGTLFQGKLAVASIGANCIVTLPLEGGVSP